VSDIQLITSAAAFAADAHLHQVRKELNEPYIVHPLRVANMAAQAGQSAEFIAAALMHDVLEDTTVPRATIASLFPLRTVELVDAMTKWWQSGQSDPEMEATWKTQYYDRLIRTEGGVLLKVLDRTDNLHDFTRMARLSANQHRWAAKYAKKTRAEFAELIPLVADPQVVRTFNAALDGLEAAL
jgi:(p)ppGpp synthase/HD superfamily hydrolase